MASFCTMSDAQITSPTWRHSVQCQMHRSRVQHGVILYNVRCTDHESKYLTLYMMMQCWTRDLCIWHYTEWCWTRDLCIWHYTWWRNVGLVICVSDIIHDDAMLDAWSVYLTLYMMTQCWTRDLCIRHYTEWCWTRDLCIWHYTEWCWTCDLCIWHYTEWIHVGHVICVSDIIQNSFMLALWSVYLTFTEWCHVGLVICVSDIYRMMPCWTHDLCIWHYTEWCHVGLMICLSNIIQNDATLDSWSHGIIL